jgi:hypothetical protein
MVVKCPYVKSRINNKFASSIPRAGTLFMDSLFGDRFVHAPLVEAG